MLQMFKRRPVPKADKAAAGDERLAAE